MIRFAAAMFAVSLSAWALMLVLRWPTDEHLLPASGAIAALGDAVLRGQAPGAEDGESFLGAYYLPPVPAAVAAARRTGLTWRDALRLVTVLSTLALLVATAIAASAVGGGRAGALLACALVLAAYPIGYAGTTGRADLLATACAIAAVAAWTRDPDLRGWPAPAFAAAAWLVKALAIAMPLAVLAWSLARRRPEVFGRFGLRFALAAVAGMALAIPVHGPQWYAQVWGDLLRATPGTWDPLRAPVEMLRYAGTAGELTVIGGLGLLTLAGAGWRASPAAAYGAAALTQALFALCYHGAAHNHLIEPVAIGAVVAGAWVARHAAGAALAGLVAIAVLGAITRDLGPLLRRFGGPAPRPSEMTALIRSESTPVLSEDALVSLAAGRRPAVSDPSALRSFSLAADPRAARVERAIRERRFGLVVLDHDLDEMAWWYREYHFGDSIAGELRGSYRKVGTLESRHLYRPRLP